MRSVHILSHACNFQDVWKWKSARPRTSRKAGYAPGWKNMRERQPGLLVSTSGSESTYPTSSAIQEHTKATGHKFSLDSARILTRRKNLVTKKIRDALQIYQRHSALNRDQGYNVAPVLLSLLSSDYNYLVAWLTMDACTLRERQSCCLINLTVKFQFVSVM